MGNKQAHMLKEIIERFSDLEIHEKRCIRETYCELVFYSKDTSEWNKRFGEVLGEAKKPAGKKIAREDLCLTQPYGGIRDDQTLYKKEFENATLIAMFWPWQDRVHTTLKIAVLEK